MPYEIKRKKNVFTGQEVLDKEDNTRFGIAKISIQEIKGKLKKLNLPSNNPLSVLAVEMFPMNNEWQYMPKRGMKNDELDQYFIRNYTENKPLNPLTEKLGNYRIYRSSPLVPVDDICCDDC